MHDVVHLPFVSTLSEQVCPDLGQAGLFLGRKLQAVNVDVDRIRHVGEIA